MRQVNFVFPDPGIPETDATHEPVVGIKERIAFLRDVMVEAVGGLEVFARFLRLQCANSDVLACPANASFDAQSRVSSSSQTIDCPMPLLPQGLVLGISGGRAELRTDGTVVRRRVVGVGSEDSFEADPWTPVCCSSVPMAGSPVLLRRKVVGVWKL